jgi:L,D-transpeptidase catalytic domain
MPQRPQQHRPRQPNAIAAFIDRYGWRAYALPVLALLTVVGLFRASSGHGRAEAVGERGTSPSVSSLKPSPPTPIATSTAPTRAATSSAPRPVRKISLAADPSKPSAAHSHAAAAAPACRSNTTARKVVVSIATQHAWMCAGKKLAYSSAVTTGMSTGGHATPTGTFKIQGNVTDTTLRGSDYAVHVEYWIEFNGDIGFHDASWQTMAFGAPGYTTQGSRGCVHMPMKTVTWLHKWVQVGRTVVVVRKS